MEFKKYNVNPYGRETEDCVTRALVLATRYGYKTIAKAIGAEFFPSLGAESVPLDSLQKFADKYHIISNYDFELDPSWDIPERELKNFSNYGGMTMGFWLEHLTKEKTGGANLVFLCKRKPDDVFPENNSKNFHAIWGNVFTKEFADLQDTRDLITFDIFVTNPRRLCNPSDPRFFTTQGKRIREEDDKYKKNLKR